MHAYLPTFDELYVLSDLHMGGERDDTYSFQIFNKGERLRNLLRRLAVESRDRDVALVINGDLFDSLAEAALEGYVALDENVANHVLDRIFRDPSFLPVWDGLQHFITMPNRYLIFVIGNHDIEIALPPVEASIRRRLGGDAPTVQSRITFATRGEGFGCLVGGARVFCTHGNEVDDWNTVDYNRLGQLANAMNAARRLDASRWEPNAGTRLVIDVMNGFKRRYPFVDLLKPETRPVLSILLTLEGVDALNRISPAAILPIVRDRIKGALITRRLLSADAEDFVAVPEATIADIAVDRLLGPRLHELVANGTGSEDALLQAAEVAIARGQRPSDVHAGSQPRTLGWMGMLMDRLDDVPKDEALRRALLDWLEEDTTFDVRAEDQTFRQITERVGQGVHYIVTGHTHLARAIKFGANRYYYNCGTWARLLRLTSHALSAPRSFLKNVYNPLQSGRMSALDAAQIPDENDRLVPLLLDRTNVVRIRARGSAAVGELLSVSDQAGGEVTLDLEPSTSEFVVS